MPRLAMSASSVGIVFECSWRVCVECSWRVCFECSWRVWAIVAVRLVSHPTLSSPPQSHPKFSTVADLQPLLYNRALQMSDAKAPQRMRLADAVDQGIIANQTLAYFIGRTYQFMTRVGITDQRLRFRQHLQVEGFLKSCECQRQL